MKIKTIIERLSKLDPEMHALINDADDDYNILDACISFEVIDLNLPENSQYLVRNNPLCCEDKCDFGKIVLIN